MSARIDISNEAIFKRFGHADTGMVEAIRDEAKRQGFIAGYKKGEHDELCGIQGGADMRHAEYVASIRHLNACSNFD